MNKSLPMSSVYKILSSFALAQVDYSQNVRGDWQTPARYLIIGSSLEDITADLEEKNENRSIRLLSSVTSWSGDLRGESSSLRNPGIRRLSQLELYVQMVANNFEAKNILSSYSFAELLLYRPLNTKYFVRKRRG